MSFSEGLWDFCLKSVRSFKELTEGLNSSIAISSLHSSAVSKLLNDWETKPLIYNNVKTKHFTLLTFLIPWSYCAHPQAYSCKEKTFSLLIPTCLALFSNLHCDKGMVDSLPLHQFIMCAQFYNFTILETSDDISISNSGQSVSHNDGGPSQPHLLRNYIYNLITET